MPAPARIPTVWQTLRHLRSRQVLHQLKRRIAPVRSVGALPIRWRILSPREATPKHTSRRFFDGEASFTFNNETRAFAGDWNEPGARKLWLYNLHYMAWLFDVEGGRDAWIRRWIRDNPAGKGNGWEPYPLSLRLFNWCKHYVLSGRPPDADVLASMGIQAGWLMANLEFHLDANHLLENLLALGYLGFFLDGSSPEARRVRARVQGLLEAELSVQFLPDGGHYELSPMYHAVLLERMLDLLTAWPDADDPWPGLREKVRAASLAALDWLDAMSVGGSFSLFNDSSYDSAPEASRLLAYGARLLGYRPRTREALVRLADSGYYRAEAGPFTLIFDAGNLGPDHQMGHAQGDMLSFCLWMCDNPVIVHPGNFEYVAGPMRDYCRSTASHNTLVVEGCEQAEWWAAHRVGWRGRVSGVTAELDAASGTISLRGSHNGYSRLPGGPLHRRAIELRTGSLLIEDSLTAHPGRPSRAMFHLHPDCEAAPADGGFRIRTPGGGILVRADQPMRLEDSWYCPEFGLRIRSRALIADCPGTRCRSEIIPIH